MSNTEDTVPDGPKQIGPGHYNKHELAQAQESNALIRKRNDAVLFTLYTEVKLSQDIPRLVSRYFKGASIQAAQGLWEGQSEHAAIVYIVGTLDDLQKVFDLAGDLRVSQDTESVLVTWQDIRRFDVNRGQQ